jgi:hypothetical protein
VPITEPERVLCICCAWNSPASLAMPKSTSLIVSGGSGWTKMFSGLRSRWTIPFECAASSASASERVSRAAETGASAPRRAIVAASVSPVSSSMTMYGRPVLSISQSKICTMPGCAMADVARASRKNRSSRSGRSTSSRASTLRAACRFRWRCSARYTCPMAPAPRSLMIR